MSVVTPTHDRKDSLRRTLLSIARQDYPLEHVEVVVVADGCTDGTVGMLRALDKELPYCLRWIAQERGGPAVARNRAIEAARGELIVFLDDDVVPTSTWLSAHLSCHGRDDRAVVVGPLSVGNRQRPIWVRWEDQSLQQQYRAMLRGAYGPTPRQFYTGNSSVRRRWIVDAGGFDPRLRRGEDVELAFRLLELGLRFYFAPEADGLHHSYRTFHSWLTIPRQYGHNDVLMAREHGRERLLGAVGREFHRRHRGTRRLARICVGRRLVYGAALGVLREIAQAANALHLERVGMAACSGVWNLAYWQGLTDALGGRSSFWRLVDSSDGRAPSRSRRAGA